MSTEVKPVPDGMSTVTPHLAVRGASDAIAFYKAAFGAVEVMRMEGPDGSIMHAQIKVGDSSIYLADECPMGAAKSPMTLGGSSVNLHLNIPDVDAMHADAVAAGAESTMPPADMFWGPDTQRSSTRSATSGRSRP